MENIFTISIHLSVPSFPPVSTPIRNGPSLFRWGRGWGGGRRVGQFPTTKNSCTAKTAEKRSFKGSHGEKLSALYFPGPCVCRFEENLAQAIAHREKNYAQPNNEEKNSMTQKIAYPPPHSKYKSPSLSGYSAQFRAFLL